MICMPGDWTDREGWDRYFRAELERARAAPQYHRGTPLFMIGVAKGQRAWFPGCGIDWSPGRAARDDGGLVLATDFSPVAVWYQQFLAGEVRKSVTADGTGGSLDVMEHDFTCGAPDVGFDVVINHSAFQGLSADHMAAAARSFHDALKPGGMCFINTMNVADPHVRRRMEDSLTAAGFYVVEQKSDQWYREQLDAIYRETGWPPERRREQWVELRELIQPKLDALRPEYAQRQQSDKAELEAIRAEGKMRVAEVIYGSG